MTDGGNWNWANWSADHPVKRVFLSSAEDVLECKREGMGAAAPTGSGRGIWNS